MAFVVNGAEWDFNGLAPEQVEALIDRALEFIETSNDREQDVVIGDDFQTRLMYDNMCLWELFTQGSPLPLRRELSQELAAWLSKAPRYADAPQWPHDFGGAEISINGAAPTTNIDLEWAHFSLREGTPTAVLTLGPNRVIETTTASGSVDVNLVSDDPGRNAFWRHAIIFAGDSLDSLIEYAPKAYPNLHLVNGVIRAAARLAGGYLASRQRVQSTLAALDDWGHWTFTCPPPAITPYEGPPPNPDARPTNQLVEHRFAGFELDAAPENPNVRQNRVCREAREIVVGERTLYCDWHVKLQKHQNRIHFHAPVPESDHKVVIGLIHEHLPLP